MPTTTSPLTPATHGLRVAASFNPRFERLLTGEGFMIGMEANPAVAFEDSIHDGVLPELVSTTRNNGRDC
jgi:hypothetical protein